MEKKLTLSDFRQVITDEFGRFGDDLTTTVASMSDEELSEANLAQDLGLDSLDVIELAMEMERIFGIITVPDDFPVIQKNGNTVQALLDVFNSTILPQRPIV